MIPSTQHLSDWLAFLESQHHTQIELGLSRVQRVKEQMQLTVNCPVIVVAGTNGKGSTCAYLASILRCAGYRVGLYTSPHLVRFNERAQINGQCISDEVAIEHFKRVHEHLDSTSLTYFEWTTLAMVDWFVAQRVDVMILEVGMGGRLDAVNVFDADCAVLTNVDLDHQAFLGDTREAIGFEKAGVFRAAKPAICVDPMPAQSVLAYAQHIGADLKLIGRDFSYQSSDNQWRYQGWSRNRSALAFPALRGVNQLLNATGALAALEALEAQLPVNQQAVREGFAQVEWLGRFQVLPGKPTTVLDVAHNPHAVAVLAQNLLQMGFFYQTHAVVGMLADKDVEGSLAKIAKEIDIWYCVPLPTARGLAVNELARIVRQVAKPDAKIRVFDSIVQAYQAALQAAEQSNTTNRNTKQVNLLPIQKVELLEQRNEQGNGDRVVVFGSFFTVADVLKQLASDALSSREA